MLVEQATVLVADGSGYAAQGLSVHQLVQTDADVPRMVSELGSNPLKAPDASVHVSRFCH